MFLFSHASVFSCKSPVLQRSILPAPICSRQTDLPFSQQPFKQLICFPGFGDPQSRLHSGEPGAAPRPAMVLLMGACDAAGLARPHKRRFCCQTDRKPHWSQARSEGGCPLPVQSRRRACCYVSSEYGSFTERVEGLLNSRAVSG